MKKLTLLFTFCAVQAVCWAQNMDTEKLNALCENSVVTIRTLSARSQGTGFVVGSEGYIVSNHHVIAHQSGYIVKDAQVAFKDGTEYDATVVAYDANLDLALLKIQPQNALTPLPIAEDLPREGAEVITIGNGIGAGFALSKGVVSTLNSQINEVPLHCFQTTVTINPGNSGGRTHQQKWLDNRRSSSQICPKGCRRCGVWNQKHLSYQFFAQKRDCLPHKTPHL